MSVADRHVGIGDPEIDLLREQLEEARTIHASEVERLAEQYLPPHEAQRKALVTLLDTLGYGAAAAVIRAGVKGGYFEAARSLAETRDGREDAISMLQEAFEYGHPTVILISEKFGS